MNDELIEKIYLSLQGQLVPGESLPWVPNLFLPYSACDQAYANMRDAYARLRQRLGVDPDEEDRDLNCMVQCLERIQEIACKEMFRLGTVYAAHLQPEE